MKLAYLRPLYPSVLHPFILSTISEFDDTANMKSPSPFLLLLLSYSFHINQASSQSTATVSIYSNVAFTSQRLCALECILCGYGTYGQHDCLAAALDCNSPLQNSCYCRTDLQPAAVSYVASCVSSACMNTLDVNSAVGIYTQYCATADQTSTFVFSSATHAATTSGGASSSIVATSTSLSIVLSTITAANGQYSTTLVTVTPTTGMRSPTRTLTRSKCVCSLFGRQLGNSKHAVHCCHNVFIKQ
jgi:hypothetical protein